MKNVLLNVLLASSLLAAGTTAKAAGTMADEPTLRAYAKRALAKCPDSIMTVTPVDHPGPSNFLIYEVDLKSSDEGCATRRYLLYSPTTQQVLIGTVIPLPDDSRPVDQRATEQASQLLGTPVTATVAPFPLPDGLKSVSIVKKTEYGPFTYHGFVDASGRFLLVASRGNLRTDAGRTLKETLNVSTNAVRRGSSVAKVEIIELSDFQCPTCGRAHQRIEPIIAKNLSKVNYARLDLPLFEHHEWSLYAAMGARAIQKVAPTKYWAYVNDVFGNQETIGKQKFDTFFKNYVEDHDIDWAKVEKIYHSPTEKAALMDQVSRAFDVGVSSTPTYIVNGQLMGYGPNGDFVTAEIKKALGVK
jgi:protein-disulfide isomerase